MNVLIACERSGVVREAFRRKGHDAYSCDLAPAEDGSPHHIQDDALKVMTRRITSVSHIIWDLVIAHPPCTRLANSGSLRLYKDGKYANGRDWEKWQEMERGALFFRQFFILTPPGTKLCVENPIQHCHAREAHGCGKPTQIVQPYHFGDDASKATGLWLRGLPPLIMGNFHPGRYVEKNGRRLQRWSNQTDGGQNKLPPSPTRAIERSKTYHGIAEAMAEQWG